MLYRFKLYINKGAQRCQLSLSYFVSEVAMAFIIYLPTLPYNILFTERRGLSSRLSRNLQLPYTVPTNKFFKTLLNYTFSDMAYVFGRAFGNSSLFIHCLCFSNRSYHIRQFSMTA